MKVFVDADACPVKQDVIDLVRDHPIILVSNRHHHHDPREDRVEHVMTGDRPDQADFYIYNRVEPDDVVITDDLGLAALVLSRGGQVIRFRGERPTQESIGPRMEMRHRARRSRRAGRRVSGPSAYDDTDRQRFRRALRDVLGRAEP